MTPIRFVFTGPESTGKSVLTTTLGARLHLPHAGEYARTYLEANGPDYDYDVLLTIYREHRAFQREHLPDTTTVGLLDTDSINYKIWYEVAFGRCPPEILRGVEEESHHRYLLCHPDLPWEPDPLREHPHDRLRLFERHRHEIERLGRPYHIVRGDGEARVQCAARAIEKWLRQPVA